MYLILIAITLPFHHNQMTLLVLQKIIFDIKQIISNPNNKKYPKYILFVGHDIGIRFNIAYLLSKANKIKNNTNNKPRFTELIYLLESIKLIMITILGLL